MRTAIVTLIVAGLPLAAYANQEWPSDTQANELPVIRVAAKIDRAVYDGSIWVTYGGKPMHVSLGAPKSMEARGLPGWRVTDGKMVILEVLNEPQDKLGRHRAQRILIDGETIKLL